MRMLVALLLLFDPTGSIAETRRSAVIARMNRCGLVPSLLEPESARPTGVPEAAKAKGFADVYLVVQDVHIEGKPGTMTITAGPSQLLQAPAAWKSTLLQRR